MADGVQGIRPWQGSRGQRPLAFLAARPWLRAWLWGLASALALSPVHLLPVLLFSVPALLRLLGAAGSWRQAAIIGWMFGFGLNLAGLYWITEPILTEAAVFWWLVPLADPLLSCAVAFYSVIPALAAFAVPPGLGRLLVFAGAWVLSDIARQFAFTGFPWNLWGSDWAIPGPLGDVFLQPAAWVGVHGLTLATVLLAGMPLFGRRGLAAMVAALVLWAGFGVARLQGAAPSTGITLALIQPNFPVPGSFDRPALLGRWQRNLAMSQAGLRAGAAAVVWPEASSPWLLADDAGARAQLVAVTGTAPVLAGSVRAVSATDYRNSLVVVAGPGPAVAVYDKWKLVPFGEYMPRWIPVQITPNTTPGTGFGPGPGPRTLRVAGLPAFAPLICYEDVFSGETIDERDRPGWLLNITDDAWFGDSAGPRQHFDAARLRAVEEGLPLVRDANSGVTAVFDAFGRVNAALPMDTQGVLVSALPGALPPTVYARFGLTLPLGLAGLAILAGGIIAFGRRGMVRPDLIRQEG